MLSPAALALGAIAGVCTLAACAYVVPVLHRHRTHSGVAHIPLGEFLSFDARVRWTSLLLWASGVSSALEVLPDVAVVAPNVIRILGQNPSRMTLRGTNTYLVGSGPKRILIDTSDGNVKYMETLLRVCREAGAREITDVLLTHGHYDHMGGILRVKEAFPHLRVWKYLPLDDKTLRVTNAECALLGVAHLQDGAEFPVPSSNDESQSQVVLRAVYTPGHYNDHMCFFLEDKESGRRALFSGDCVLGSGSCVFDSLKELMTSLTLLQAQNPYVIHPGHGPVVHDAKGKIHEYISHREQREGEVLAALEAANESADADSSSPAAVSAALSSAQIVTRIYPKLPFALQLAARKAVDKHLHKLLLDKRVVKNPSRWFTAATYRLVASAPRANL